MSRIQLDSEAASAIKDRLASLNQQQGDLFSKLHGYIDAANSAWDGALADTCRERQASIKLDTTAITEMFTQYINAFDAAVQELVEAEREVASRMNTGQSTASGAASSGIVGVTAGMTTHPNEKKQISSANLNGSTYKEYRGEIDSRCKKQCVGYAKGRAGEVLGITFEAGWRDKADGRIVKGNDGMYVTKYYPPEAESVQANSIADFDGHVVFIEDVWVDESGVMQVTFSEANWGNHVDGNPYTLPIDRFMKRGDGLRKIIHYEKV